jgi:putative transcriptional regulator
VSGGSPNLRPGSPRWLRRRRLGALVVTLLTCPALGSPGWAQATGADDPAPAVGTFLVARRDLPDPNFFETVVLLLAYEAASGAVGVVVNRRSDIAVGDAVDAGGPLAGRQDWLYLGGPVDLESMIVLLRGDEPPVEASRIVGDVFMVRASGDLERLMSADPPPADVRFYAGYAGWSPGQLEDEIARGVWHLVGARPSWVFSDTPEEAWTELIRILFSPRA